MAVAESILSLLMYFCLLNQIAQSKSILRRDREPPFKALCSRMCQTQEQQPTTDGDFPLYQCSCSRSCSIYGDCCYDSPHKNTTIGQKTDFICVSVVGHGQYKAVSGCPSDQVADFCKDGLGYRPPVTSKETGITYANRYCASCNGERENLIIWNVELRCPSDLNDGIEDNPNATTTYIYRSGEFWSLNEQDGSKRLCMFYVHFNDSTFMKGLELRLCTNVKKMSECSASWKDLEVLKMCRSYEDPVYFHNTAYQNSHCARCNYLNLKYGDCIPFRVKTILQMGLVDLSVDNFCMTRGLDSCIQSLSDMEKWQKGRRYAFSRLFNIYEESCVPPKGRKCCRGEYFDRIISGRCKKVEQ